MASLVYERSQSELETVTPHSVWRASTSKLHASVGNVIATLEHEAMYVDAKNHKRISCRCSKQQAVQEQPPVRCTESVLNLIVPDSLMKLNAAACMQESILIVHIAT
eukprot:12199-Heterococcus_DN1.PRE.2